MTLDFQGFAFLSTVIFIMCKIHNMLFHKSVGCGRSKLSRARGGGGGLSGQGFFWGNLGSKTVCGRETIEV